MLPRCADVTLAVSEPPQRSVPARSARERCTAGDGRPVSARPSRASPLRRGRPRRRPAGSRLALRDCAPLTQRSPWLASGSRSGGVTLAAEHGEEAFFVARCRPIPGPSRPLAFEVRGPAGPSGGRQGGASVPRGPETMRATGPELEVTGFEPNSKAPSTVLPGGGGGLLGSLQPTGLVGDLPLIAGRSTGGGQVSGQVTAPLHAGPTARGGRLLPCRCDGGPPSRRGVALTQRSPPTSLIGPWSG
jgi:hypothetical protein